MKSIKSIILIIIIALAALAGWWFWQSGQLEAPQQLDTGTLPNLPEVSEEDTTGQIQDDLEQVDLGDIDAEFEDIDVDLNNL